MDNPDVGVRIDAIRRSFAERHSPPGSLFSTDAAGKPTQDRLEAPSQEKTRSHGTAAHAPNTFVQGRLSAAPRFSSSASTGPSQTRLGQSPCSESRKHVNTAGRTGGPRAARVAPLSSQGPVSSHPISNRAFTGGRRKEGTVRHPASSGPQAHREKEEATSAAHRANDYQEVSSVAEEAMPPQELNALSEDVSPGTGFSSGSDITGDREES
jgi:hypothetical protein